MSDERDDQMGQDEDVEAHRARLNETFDDIADDDDAEGFRAKLNDDDEDDVEAHRWGSHSPDETRAAMPDERQA